MTLPSSKESEMMVLGSMLTYTNTYATACKKLDESDFYHAELKEVFRALKSLYQRGKPTGVLIVDDELKRLNKQQIANSFCLLSTLCYYGNMYSSIDEQIDEIRKYSQLRQLIQFGEKLTKRAFDNSENPKNLTFEAHEEIRRIEKRSRAREKFSIRFANQFTQNLLLTEPSKQPMLLEGFLPKGIVAMLVTRDSIEKPDLLAELALSIATGEPWQNTFTTTTHCGKEKMGNVFIGMGENQYNDIHRILYKSSKRLGQMSKKTLLKASKRIAVFSFFGQQATFIENDMPSRYFRELKLRLVELAPKKGWSLIILDPITRLLGKNDDASQFIALLEELTIDLPGNPTVLFTHQARGPNKVCWQANFIKSQNTALDIQDMAILKLTKSNLATIMEEIMQ